MSHPTRLVEGAAQPHDVQQATVRVEGVRHVFRKKNEEVHALGPIDLEVGNHEFLVVIGPSGCGKSTLLNLIGGLLPPSEGTVEVNGHPVTGVPEGVGMMFQAPTLLDWRTAIENILLPIEIGEGRKGAVAATGRALELLEMVGLAGFEHKYPHELSGGMKQRVAICRMLIEDPALMLLDEPFGALDELTRERMDLEMSAVFERDSKSAVCITHNIHEAVLLADRIVVMTGRPGVIKEIVDVDLPRPRTVSTMNSSRFQELVGMTRDLLTGGGNDN